MRVRHTGREIVCIVVRVGRPAPLRRSGGVVLGACLGPGVPSKQAVIPYPTRSMIVAPEGQAPVSAVVVETSATLPAVADIAMAPIASGDGSGVVPPAPAASWIK